MLCRLLGVCVWGSVCLGFTCVLICLLDQSNSTKVSLSVAAKMRMRRVLSSKATVAESENETVSD